MRAANAVPLIRLCGWRLLAVGSDEGDGGASASDLRAAQLRVTELERTNSSLTKRARTAEARVAELEYKHQLALELVRGANGLATRMHAPRCVCVCVYLTPCRPVPCSLPSPS